MTVREVLSEALSLSVTSLAKDHGFRKKALTFRRHHGQTTQVVNFQLSRGNSSESGTFYVNIGISFDAVAALGGNTTGQVVIAGEAMHFAARLEELAPKVPDAWEVTERTDAQALGKRLGATLAPVMDRLDRIESPAGMLREFPLDQGFERLLRAQLQYVLGDFNAALAELRQLAAEFADRQGISVEKFIEEQHLEELRRHVS